MKVELESPVGIHFSSPRTFTTSALIDRLAANVESDASLTDVIVTIVTSPEFARVQRPAGP